MKYYPIAIRVDDKPITVVGAGPVAERKILSLLKAGASVKVISPNLTTKLKRLVKKDQLAWRRGPVKKIDLREGCIVIAATSDTRVNENVSNWARQKKSWVNVVDRAALSDFISPAILRKRRIILAVYTDGRDPELSRDLKNFLEENWDEFLSYRNRS